MSNKKNKITDFDLMKETHERLKMMNGCGLESEIAESKEDFSQFSVQELADKYMRANNCNDGIRDGILNYMIKNLTDKERDVFLILMENPHLISSNEIGEDLGNHEYNY